MDVKVYLRLPMLRPDGTLTRRQQEVLRLVADGLANKEIAGTLSLSKPCIKKHVGVLLRRLEVPNRTALIKRAIQLNLIEVTG